MRVFSFRGHGRWNGLNLISIMMGLLLIGAWGDIALASPEHQHDHLGRAKIYLAAGDYRRALEACQRHVDTSPSAESYVYLTYIYEAIDGYLDWLAKRDEWGKVGQLSLNLTSKDNWDLIDPPDVLPRMVKELLHEGLRQQFDLTAAMANRLDKPLVDRMWQQQAAWRKAQSGKWWAGVPEEWKW